MALPLISFAGIISCLTIALCVFGVAVCRLFRWRWILRQGPGICAVIGLAGSVLFLEVWNFLYPVNHASVLVLGLLTLGLALVFWRTLIETARTWMQSGSVVTIGPLLLLLLLVSLFGLGAAEHGHYDTGLYYLNTIRWEQEYPVIPGLANLHARLGYNSSFFLFVAFLSRIGNLGLARACQIVNPLFVFVAAWPILDHIGLSLTSRKAKPVRLYAILLLCPIFFLATHNDVSAPTGDIAAAAFAIPGALAFFCFVEDVAEKNGLSAVNWLLVLAVFNCTVAKLKLSYAALGGVGIGVAGVALIFVLPRGFLRSWIQTAVICLSFSLPFMGRGVVLSGYPFFPSTFIRFRTDWAVSRRAAESERLWIYSWARMPDKNPSEVLGNSAWFVPWIKRNAKDPENLFLTLFLTVGLVSGLLSFLIPMNRKDRLLTALLIAPAFLALIFWFKTAPDPRFGYATLWLCGVNCFYSFTRALANLSVVRASLWAILIVLGSISFISRTQFPTLSGHPKKFPQGFPRAELEFQTTKSGLRIGVPKHEQSWDSGLVVTPYFNPNLVLRGRQLRDGFRVVNPNP